MGAHSSFVNGGLYRSQDPALGGVNNEGRTSAVGTGATGSPGLPRPLGVCGVAGWKRAELQGK